MIASRITTASQFESWRASKLRAKHHNDIFQKSTLFQIL